MGAREEEEAHRDSYNECGTKVAQDAGRSLEADGMWGVNDKDKSFRPETESWEGEAARGKEESFTQR